MKVYIIYCFTLMLVFISCKETKRSISPEENCPPEYIWINYVGITDKIKDFILIRTCESDTSYYDIYRKDWPDFFYDKDFFEIHCNSFVVSNVTFEKMTEYIKSNNTHKQENIINTDNYNAIKISFVDKKNSLTYIVNKENSDFFENLKCSVNIKNEHLKSSLKYYHKILNKN